MTLVAARCSSRSLLNWHQQGASWLARAVAFGLLLGVLAGNSCAAADEVVVRSGKVIITESEVRQLVESLGDADRAALVADPAALNQLLRNRVAWLKALEEAKAKKWPANALIAFRAEQVKNEFIVNSYLAEAAKPGPNYPTDADIEAAYAANQAKFVVPRQYRLAQIFFSDRSGTSEANLQRLVVLRQQLVDKKINMEAAARQSDNKSVAETGGLFDWLPEDQLTTEIRKAVQELAPGEFSQPVRAGDGWHLIQMVEMRAASTLPLDKVRQQLVDALRQQKAADGARAYLAAMLAKNPVQIDEIRLGNLLGRSQ